MWGIVIYCHHSNAMQNIPLFISCPSCRSVEVKSRFSDFTPCGSVADSILPQQKMNGNKSVKRYSFVPYTAYMLLQMIFFQDLNCNCCNYGLMHILIFGTQYSLTCTLCLKLCTKSRKKPVHGLFERLSRRPPNSQTWKIWLDTFPFN